MALCFLLQSVCLDAQEGVQNSGIKSHWIQGRSRKPGYILLLFDRRRVAYAYRRQNFIGIFYCC